MRYKRCHNCGENSWTAFYGRYCDDCWRMLFKTLGATFGTALATWMLNHLKNNF